MLRDRDAQIESTSSKLGELEVHRDRLTAELHYTQAVRNKLEQTANVAEKEFKIQLAEARGELTEVWIAEMWSVCLFGGLIRVYDFFSRYQKNYPSPNEPWNSTYKVLRNETTSSRRFMRMSVHFERNKNNLITKKMPSTSAERLGCPMWQDRF